MRSLAKATSQLLQHLLTEYQLAIRKRSLVLCGLFTLLGNSLILAKQGSSAFQSESDACKGSPEEGVNFFKETFFSIRGLLEKQFRGNLLHASEEFQVQDSLKLYFRFSAF